MKCRALAGLFFRLALNITRSNPTITTKPQKGEGVKNIISLGAGVQSTTMALMAACGELLPMPDAAVFADTQDEPLCAM